MSTQVDNRVVQMKFNNKEFEKGVSQTQQSIGDLNNSLNNLGKDAEKQNFIQRAFNSISDSIDETSKKFNVIEEIGIGAFRRIGEQITDTAESLIKSVTIDQAVTGWSKYENIVSNTAGLKNVAAFQGYDYNMVKEKLKQLQWYADSTSYDMNAMTSALLSMANAGIDLKKATKVVMGLGNSFSYAGATATQMQGAFYMFSKALGEGMNLGQAAYRSLESTYHVISPELKKMWMDEAVAIGTLTKKNNKYYVTANKNIEVTSANLNTTLREQWLNGDVLSKVYSKSFGDYAKGVYNVTKKYKEQYGITLSVTEAMDKYDEEHVKAGKDIDEFGRKVFEASMEAKTFSEVIDATKDAASSAFSNIYQSIFGDYEKAKKTFTDLGEWAFTAFVQPIVGVADMIENWSSKTTNVINEATGKKLTGRTALMRSIGEFDRYVKSIILPLKKGFQEVLPMADYQKLLDLTGKLYTKIHALTVTEEQAERLKATGKAIANTLKDIINIGKIAIGMVKKLWEVVQPLTVYPKKFFNILVDANNYLHDTFQGFDLVTRVVNGFGKSLINAKTKVSEFVKSAQISGEVTAAIISAFSPSNFDYESLKGEMFSFYDWIKTATKNAIGFVGLTFKAAFGGIEESLTSYYNEQKAKLDKTYGDFNGFCEAMKTKLYELKSHFLDFILEVKKFFGLVKDTTEDGTTALDAKEKPKTLFDYYYEQMSKAPSAFDKFIEMMKQLLKVVKQIFGIELIRQTAKFIKSWKQLTEALAEGFKVLAIGTPKPSKLVNLGKTFLMIAVAMAIIAAIPDTAMLKVGLTMGGLAGVLVGFTFLTKYVAKNAKDLNGQAMLKYFKGIGKVLILMAVAMKTLDSIKDPWKAIGLLGGLVIFCAGLMLLSKVVAKNSRRAAFGELGIMLYKFAAALLVMTSVLKVLDTIDNPEEVMGMLWDLTGVLAAVFVLTAVMERLSKKGTKGPSRLGPLFISIGVAMLGLSLALAILTHVDQPNLWSAVGAMSAIMLVLALLVTAINEVDGKDILKASAAMLTIGLAFAGLAAAILLISLIPNKLLLKGGLVIVAILGILALIGHFKMTNYNGLAGALIALGAGMLLFAMAMKKVSETVGNGLLPAFGTLVIFMGIMVALGILAKTFPGIVIGMLAVGAAALVFGAALLLIAKAIKTFAKMDRDTLGRTMTDMIISFCAAIAASADAITEAIISLNMIVIKALIGTIKQTIEEIISFCQDVFPEAIKRLKEKLGLDAEASFGELMHALGQKFTTWVKEKAWPFVKEAMETVGQKMIDGLLAPFRWVKNLIALKKTGKDAAKKVNEGVEEEEDMHSPSRVWAKYGSYMMAGMAKGLKESTKMPVQQAEKSSKIINKAMAAVGSNIDSDMSTEMVITPVLDLSNIQNESLSGLIKDPVVNPRLAYQPVGDYDRMMQFTSGIDSLSTKLGDLLSKDDADIGAAVREALSGMGIYMNGRTVGKMLNGYQSNLAKARG